MKKLHLIAPLLGLTLAAACGGDDNGPSPAGPDAGPDESPTACELLECGHGTCSESGGVASCECDPAWSGDGCDVLSPPPQADLLLWLDGADPLGDGTAVAPGTVLDSWFDKGPSALQFASTGDERPITADGPAGFGLVSFDGIDDFMSVEGFPALDGVTDYTVIIVGYGGGTENTFLAGVSASGSEHGLLIESAPGKNLRFLHRMPWGNSGGDNVVTAANAMDTGALNRIWISRAEGELDVDMLVYINDELGEIHDGTAVAFDDDLDLVLGRLGVDEASRYLDGEIAEILIYAGSSSPDVDTEIEEYLAAKWGL